MSAGPGPDDWAEWQWARGARELRWGLKRSFLDYLSGTGDLALSMDGGVRALPQEQAFSFPVAGPVAGARDGAAVEAVRFAGSLVLTAHFGALRVLVADPWLEPAPDGARLTVARPEEWAPGPARFCLADLRPLDVLEEGGWVATRFDAALAPDGVAMFGGVYPPGEPFDHVVVMARPGA